MIEYVESVQDGVVRYYESTEESSGFRSMSVQAFREMLYIHRGHLDDLESELENALGETAHCDS